LLGLGVGLGAAAAGAITAIVAATTLSTTGTVKRVTPLERDHRAAEALPRAAGSRQPASAFCVPILMVNF